VQGIEYTGLLHSPSKMLSVIDVLTRNGNISTDTGLTASKLLQMAEDLHAVKSSQVQFTTVPWSLYQPNPNWVQWQEPSASRLFSAIAHDTRLPKASGHKTKAATINPSQVQVAVYNGGARSGSATSTARALRTRGFDVIGSATDAATDTYTNSVIEYDSSAQLLAAQTLAQQIGKDVTLQLDPQIQSSVLHLILGSKFTALQSATTNKSAGSGVDNLASTYGGITGNTKICSDKNAFSGPLGY
jgi:hypothetical protein